jgi:2-dehydropantoate 2-reductase
LTATHPAAPPAATTAATTAATPTATSAATTAATTAATPTATSAATTAATTAATPTATKTLVVGGGAVGSFLGTLLALAGHEVTLVRPVGPGLGPGPITLVERDGTRRQVEITRVVRTEDAPKPDLMLVCVKMPIVREALAPTLRWPDVPTLTVQNGIGAEDIAAEVRASAPRLACSMTASISLTPQDEVFWLSRGGIGLAAMNPAAEPMVRQLVADFARVGLRSAELHDPRSMKWSKVLANMLANATGAILDMDADSIYRDKRLFEIERAQTREGLAVMKKLGLHPVSIPGAPVPLLVLAMRLPGWLGRPILRRAIGGARGDKQPSLRLHVGSAAPGKPAAEPTEAAWLYGAVARFGAEVGVATPVNARLATLVDEVAMNPERREWFRGNPDRLLAELDH